MVICAEVAQLVEQSLRKGKVGGSSPLFGSLDETLSLSSFSRAAHPCMKKKQLIVFISIVAGIALLFGIFKLFKSPASKNKNADAFAGILQQSAAEQRAYRETEKLALEFFPEEYKKLQGTLQTEAQAGIEEATKGFNAIVDEINRGSLAATSPLVDAIKTNKHKSNAEYVKEMTTVVDNMKGVSFNLRTPASLTSAGTLYRQSAVALSRIQPPPSFYNVHVVWVSLFAGKGYALTELGKSPDADHQYFLHSFLNQLIDQEAQALALMIKK